MRFKRKPTRGGWTPESSARAHAAKARKRLESPPDYEPRKLDDGEFLGVLQWQSVDGSVRRWTITQGPRANNIRVIAKGKEVACGWDYLLSSLRKKLAMPKRRLSN